MSATYSTRTAENLPTWQLTDFAAIAAALEALSILGWRGQPKYDPNSQTWKLELNIDDPTQQVNATTGDYLVLDYTLRALSPAEYAAAGYTPAS